MPTKIVHNYFIFISFLLYLCYTLFHPCGFAFGRVGRGRSKALAPIGLYFTPRNAKGMSSGMIMALKMTAARGGINHGFTRIYTDLLLRGVYVVARIRPPQARLRAPDDTRPSTTAGTATTTHGRDAIHRVRIDQVNICPFLLYPDAYLTSHGSPYELSPI